MTTKEEFWQQQALMIAKDFASLRKQYLSLLASRLADRPTKYFVAYLDRTKLDAALRKDFESIDISDYIDFIDAKTMREATKIAQRFNPPGHICMRTDIRPVAWDYGSDRVDE